jgi:hypothetical protein
MEIEVPRTLKGVCTRVANLLQMRHVLFALLHDEGALELCRTPRKEAFRAVPAVHKQKKKWKRLQNGAHGLKKDRKWTEIAYPSVFSRPPGQSFGTAFLHSTLHVLLGSSATEQKIAIQGSALQRSFPYKGQEGQMPPPPSPLCNERTNSNTMYQLSMYQLSTSTSALHRLRVSTLMPECCSS